MSFHYDVKPILSPLPSDAMFPDTSLPTPPTSPSEPPRDPQSVVLLNSLVQFYQQEALWVHRTRAALELALASQGRTPVTDIPMAPTPSSTDSDDQSVKAEPTSPLPMGRSNPHSRWLQRKKSFKLKLEGIPNQSMLKRRRYKRHAAANATETGTRLLELFGQLMEARMESCHRVNQLVKEAGQPDIL
ncbi:hypothetical protein EVG20_g5449 [Dentipellis fragilis]|uniref:Uncharacterized protein n=1 Tax=Dentipellis fragilis TaxID=205917 RepID=A0A4Y9YT88_9AGAM|nr:hypothetical protein EVG20_g5449 [Dentipellis fragilis]